MTGSPEVEILQLEYDSRRVAKGCLFCAVKGYQFDGNDYIHQAVENGAVAVISEREGSDLIDNFVQVPNVRQAMGRLAAKFYGFPANDMTVIGITGTNGKTTTSYLIRAILEDCNIKTGLVTSNVYATGTKEYPASRTTPEALDLQRYLFEMKESGCTHAVLEVSSHALELNRVEAISFNVAVYTNLTRDHLDFHSSMEEYLQAKAKLLNKLRSPMSYMVINIDQPEFKKLFGEIHASYLTYSLSDTSADVYCRHYQFYPDKTVFEIVTPLGIRQVNFNLPGKFNLQNSIAAFAGGIALGQNIDCIVSGLENAQPVAGRFNYLKAGQDFGIFIDFAHTPDALTRLCEAAREISTGRILVLFGCGGDRDKGKRPLMGEAATLGADFVVVTSDNPRSENPETIIEEIKPGLQGEQYKIIVDRTEAIKEIIALAKTGDTVLLAGKGAENYQEINGVKHPFSDEDIARSALKEMGILPVSEGT